MTSKKANKILRSCGFSLVRKGKHLVYKRGHEIFALPVRGGRDLSPAMRNQILKIKGGIR